MQSLFYSVSKTVQNCICLCSGKHDILFKTTFLVLFVISGSAYGAGGKNVSDTEQLLLPEPVQTPDLLRITPAMRELWTVV